MSLGYTIAYRIGFTPWERAGRAGAKELSSLFEREETGRGVPFGRALDLGCGTGAHTIELAGRGWQATGIDMVPRAVQMARQRAAAAGAGNGVRFIRGDVTALEASEAGTGFSFLLDVGCFHGLSDSQRTAMARVCQRSRRRTPRSCCWPSSQAAAGRCPAAPAGRTS